MKKQTMITLALALTLAMPTLPAFAQKAMSKKEIAEKEKAFKNLQHPWKGKKVAYFGDSITDPNIKASKVKYWGFLQDWLGITPYVYGVSGRQWNDIPVRQTNCRRNMVMISMPSSSLWVPTITITVCL